MNWLCASKQQLSAHTVDDKHLLYPATGTIADNSTGDVTDDMYHRWRSDIELMKQLGIKNYRFEEDTKTAFG